MASFLVQKMATQICKLLLTSHAFDLQFKYWLDIFDMQDNFCNALLGSFPEDATNIVDGLDVFLFAEHIYKAAFVRSVQFIYEETHLY